ncbi:Pol polyprotein [Plakobranchus ocellatus]|uniref:Pol polyprotein n=1 Tax=Plakobranchus ocellatus TaxID=259542 RepID=A0AAV4CIH8_9GAST|nr:Pol polyprotein [Plakobranchus ocellatus]
MKKSNTPTPRHPLTLCHASYPMERVHLDFLGPLPKTKSGNEYVLMIVDQFTKWVGCIPLPSQTAEVTATAIVREFFSRFGCPLQIFTDQGRNFESGLFKSLCTALHIRKYRTTPYHPSSNDQVERYNRTLLNAVRCYLNGRQDRWDECVAQIASALRASVNRTTGYTPNRLMLGREVNTPLELMFAPPQAVQPMGGGPLVDAYVSHLIDDIQQSYSQARETLKSTQLRMKSDYDIKARVVQYSAGDAVYVCDKATLKGRCDKLKSPWKGPGLVLSVLTPYLLKIQIRNNVSVINHDHVKPCRDRELPKWLIKARQRLGSGAVYCICRLPDTRRTMVQCDQCLEWFHCDCVGLSTAGAKRLSEYLCPECTPQ